MSTPTFSYERRWYARGARLVVGVDEAGAGALAGPIVAAAAFVPLTSRLGGINDSKVLSAAAREELFASFGACGIRVATGTASVEEIAALGLRPANLLALQRAVEAFSAGGGSAFGAGEPDAVLVDYYRIPGLPCPQEAIVRGDRVAKSIAAASIAAKVTRDRMLIAADTAHPGYGFALHKGYGTPAHLAALSRLGPSPYHRAGFAPVAARGLTVDPTRTS